MARNSAGQGALIKVSCHVFFLFLLQADGARAWPAGPCGSNRQPSLNSPEPKTQVSPLKNTSVPGRAVVPPPRNAVLLERRPRSSSQDSFVE